MNDAKLDDARVLTLLACQSQPLTPHEIAEQMQMTLHAVRSALQRLTTIGRVAPVGERATKRNPARYAAVYGQPIHARQQDAWSGVDWSVSTMRPGCLDHERIPSRRGDQRVPHMPPQHFATSSVAQVRER